MKENVPVESISGSKIEFGAPFTINKSQTNVVAYNYPGPLSCLSGVNKGCSDIVDAGPQLGGMGRFCNYAVVCAGFTVTIFYEEFRVTA